jgi:hypothetical protein
MTEMMRKGLGGMGKMGAEMPAKMDRKPAAKEPVKGDGMGEEKLSTITHHADGSHTSQMEGGEEMQHPDHLHLMAHIGHHLTGGDAHHVMHDDGMEQHHHSVEEDGEHHEGELHGEDDPDMQHEESDMEEHDQPYGGMGM